MDENALFSAQSCRRIAAEIARCAGAAGCSAREIQEGMIHAWRCHLAGGSEERAVRQGVLHAETLRQARGGAAAPPSRSGSSLS